jgi:putative FmdB family regulatory protein
MPIYEYRCLECGRISAIFLRSLNSQNVRCPACGSYKLDRLLSASYTLKTGASTPGMTCCGRTERCETPPCSSNDTCRRDSK